MVRRPPHLGVGRRGGDPHHGRRPGPALLGCAQAARVAPGRGDRRHRRWPRWPPEPARGRPEAGSAARATVPARRVGPRDQGPDPVGLRGGSPGPRSPARGRPAGAGGRWSQVDGQLHVPEERRSPTNNQARLYCPATTVSRRSDTASSAVAWTASTPRVRPGSAWYVPASRSRPVGQARHHPLVDGQPRATASSSGHQECWGSSGGAHTGSRPVGRDARPGWPPPPAGIPTDLPGEDEEAHRCQGSGRAAAPRRRISQTSDQDSPRTAGPGGCRRRRRRRRARSPSTARSASRTRRPG